jgi:hypothetical protein
MSALRKWRPRKKRLGEPGDFPGMPCTSAAARRERFTASFSGIRNSEPRALLVPLLIVFGMAAEATGVNWLIGVAAYFMLVALLGQWAYKGFLVRRTISWTWEKTGCAS